MAALIPAYGPRLGAKQGANGVDFAFNHGRQNLWENATLGRAIKIFKRPYERPAGNEQFAVLPIPGRQPLLLLVRRPFPLRNEKKIMPSALSGGRI